MNRADPSHITTLMPPGCWLLGYGAAPSASICKPILMFSFVPVKLAYFHPSPWVEPNFDGRAAPQTPVPAGPPQTLSEARNMTKLGYGHAQLVGDAPVRPPPAEAPARIFS